MDEIAHSRRIFKFRNFLDLLENTFPRLAKTVLLFHSFFIQKIEVDHVGVLVGSINEIPNFFILLDQVVFKS